MLILQTNKKINKKSLFYIIIFLTVSNSIFPQKLLYKAELNNFFDNNEFSGSLLKSSQTMAGTHIAPQIGVGFGKKHKILAGLDIMHEWGSNKIVDFTSIIAYYEYSGKYFRFSAGAFPRKERLDKYPKMFFQDSINNYRPTVNGVFWEFAHRKNYLNVWLDWTGRQSPTRHEAFFMGWSGRYNYKMLYVQHFGYMFHYASRMSPNHDPVIDNGLILTQLGIDLAKITGLNQLETNLGWSAGLDRERGAGGWHTPQGLLWETKVEYRGLELNNSYYRGKGQQTFYAQHGNDLYWGEPLYRSTEYNKLDLILHFFKSNIVNIKFVYSFHFVEKQLFQQQSLYATFKLDNFSKKNKEKYLYLWDRWFGLR